MDREINLDSILALDKQIEEHEGPLIQLKRARNSLLNVSILLPPEILGTIFRWNATPDEDFGNPPKGSYNFLLVCHHWFEVASHTPELWSFWGNSIQDWTHRHVHCGTAPIDLVLNDVDDDDEGDELDDGLRNALQGCAARDAIRRVHLRSGSSQLLNSIIFSIVTKAEGTRSNSVESFAVQSYGEPIPDVSLFFSRYHLPKLRCLRLLGCTISSWDLLKSQTMALTTIELTFSAAPGISPTPTPPQLLGILSSNPLLQHLILSFSRAPHFVDSERTSSPVPLRHLKKLSLSGIFPRAFELLNQLELPDEMDNLYLYLKGCTSANLSQTLGPYIGERVRRRGRSSGGELTVLTMHNYSTLSVYTGDTYQEVDSAEMDWFVEVAVVMNRKLEDEEADELCFGLVGHIPQGRVTSFRTALPILRSEELCVEMCNLTHLYLDQVNLSTWPVEPDARGSHVFKDLLPGLRHIVIDRFTLSGGDWGPFTNFMYRRAAVGNPIYSLLFIEHPHMGQDLVESIRPALESIKCAVESVEGFAGFFEGDI